MKAICVHCQQPIKAGRSDKKFCDSTCKDAYHNDQKGVEHAEIKRIDLLLKQNRRVLRKLYEESKKPDKLVSKGTLLKEGFSFGFMTHIVETRGQTDDITFCYDYGYRPTKPGQFQLFHSFSKVQVKNGDRVQVLSES